MEVLLRSTDGHDRYFERRLKLTADTPVQVGRSSKTGARNVQPARTNAFIESPVISREHAIFTVRYLADSESPDVFLTDTGSMHGTYINKEKLKEHEPMKLQNGSKLTFGAFVFRNSETFPAREFEVYLQRSSQSTEIETPGTFKVPDGESSEEEAYESSQMGDSDAESDSSAPEAYPLTRSGNDDDNRRKEPNSIGACDVIPDSMAQHVGCMTPDEDWRWAFHSKPTDDPTKESQVEVVAERSSPVEVDRERSFSPHYSPMSPNDKQGKTIPYTEISESRSVSSSPVPEIIDEEEISDVDSESSGVRSRSVSICSHVASDDEEDEDEDELEILPTHLVSHIDDHIVPEQAIFEARDDTLMRDSTKDWTTPWPRTAKDEQQPEIQSGDFLTTFMRDLAQSATVNDRTTEPQLTQPMSLARIMDGPSKNMPITSSSETTRLVNPSLQGRVEAVTVESLLNSSPLVNDNNITEYRPWKPLSAEQALELTKQSPAQQAIRERSNFSQMPSFDNNLDSAQALDAQQYAQFCSYPTAADYQENFGSINYLRSIYPELQPKIGAESKEVPKSKTSIAISDIVDNNPVIPASRAQKRKADVLEEELTTEAPVTNSFTELQEEVKELTQEIQPIPTEPIPSSTQSQSAHIDMVAPPPKRRRLHPGSFVAGSILGGIGVFAALVFLPESAFQ